MIQGGGEKLWYVIHELINYILNNEEFHDPEKESNIVPIYKKVKR
jgi:hypothetical protein